jgi:hypothetical protein
MKIKTMSKKVLERLVRKSSPTSFTMTANVERLLLEDFLSHSCQYSSEEPAKVGAIGGHISYSYKPAENGSVVKVSCECGESQDITHYDVLDSKAVIASPFAAMLEKSVPLYWGITAEISQRLLDKFLEHKCQHRRKDELVDEGTIEYIVSETSLGTVVKVNCDCGKSEDLTCYDLW